jgi:hypothetical protein
MSWGPFFRSPFGFLLPLAVLGLAASCVIPHCARHEPDPAPAPHAPLAAPPGAPRSALPAPPASPAPARPALVPVAPDPRHPRSPLADPLHSPATTAADDLRAVGEILRLYRERFGAYPAFETNAQLVNALAGANPRRLALLPRDAPAVSPARGELLDRWGTPLHFHSVSREHLELRSAGPDRALYTADDLLLPVGGPPTPDAAASP